MRGPAVLLALLFLATPATANQTDMQIADYCRNLYPENLGARRACIDSQRIAAEQVFAWVDKTRESPDARYIRTACARATQLNNGGYHWPDQHSCIGAEVAALNEFDKERERAKTDDFTKRLIRHCGSSIDAKGTDAYRRLVQCLVIQRKAGEKVSEMYQFFQPRSPERDIINGCAQRLLSRDGTYDWPKVKDCADAELAAAAAVLKKKKRK